jgi:hypothetical protein
LKLLPSVTSPAKTLDEWVYASGFGNRLPSTLYQCRLNLVKLFFFYESCFSMLVVCALKS